MIYVYIKYTHAIHLTLTQHSLFHFLHSFAKLRKATISFIMSVRPSAWKNSASTRQVFMKIYIWVFSQICRKKFKLNKNRKRITVILHEDEQHTFWIICRSLLLRMSNVPSCRDNRSTLLCSITFFSKIVPFMRECGKIGVQPDRPQMTIWRMRIAYWIHKATKTLRMCNTYCFSTATIVAQKRFSGT